MNPFRKLFAKIAPAPSISDPILGRLTYDHGIWTRIPKSKTDGIMLIIIAPASGPSLAQREFIQRLTQSMPALTQAARAFIKPDAVTAPDRAALQPYSLEIGPDDDVLADRFTLELTDADQIIIHRVTFTAGRPTDYTYDD